MAHEMLGSQGYSRVPRKRVSVIIKLGANSLVTYRDQSTSVRTHISISLIRTALFSLRRVAFVSSFVGSHIASCADAIFLLTLSPKSVCAVGHKPRSSRYLRLGFFSLPPAVKKNIRSQVNRTEVMMYNVDI